MERIITGLFDVARELCFILDKDGKFIIVNEFGASSLDYSVQEILDKHFTDIIDPTFLSLVNSSITLALKMITLF